MKFKTKGFISLLLACSFTVAAVSGTMLYLTPRGRTANWSGWTLAGLDKHQWSALHINACLIVLLVAALHLVFNWKVFWSYIKKRTQAGLNLKLEMGVALLLSVALVAGTLYDVPPLTYPITLNENIKNYWDQQQPSGPAPHAEEFTVAQFAETVGLTADQVVDSWQKAGYRVDDQGLTLAALAESNQVVPDQLLAAVRSDYPEVMPVSDSGRGPGRGRGQGGGFGGARGEASGGSCEQGAEGGCSQDAASGGQPATGHASGQGRGQGMGMGMGRGMGMGAGRGMGMGMGRGMGGGQGAAGGQGGGCGGESQAAKEAGCSSAEGGSCDAAHADGEACKEGGSAS